MAAVKSLGIHTPSALPYLVAEGILPHDSPESSYVWQTVSHRDESGQDAEEELLATRFCVVWSRAGVVQRVFRFEVEEEAVVQALLTRFPTSLKGQDNLPVAINTYPSARPTDDGDKLPKGVQPESLAHIRPQKQTNSSLVSSSLPVYERALVVILMTQAHVFYLSGTSHVVHLPFEVSSAFALPQGVLFQRKILRRVLVEPTPVLPSAPLNSFAFSNSNASWKMPSSQPLQDIANGCSVRDESQLFEDLFRGILNQSKLNDDVDLPRHICLRDPLSEMGLIVTAPQIPSSSRRYQSVAGKVMDTNEDVLYVSPVDELEQCAFSGSKYSPLMVALTQHRETGLNTLWTISHPDKEVLAQYGGQRGAMNRASTRRRSSYGPGTGATTPALRKSVGPVEPLVGLGDLDNGKDNIPDESDLAAQLDPAFENPSLPAKSSRRVSSFVARSGLSTNHDRTTFPDLAGSHIAGFNSKRGASMGTHPARTSFGITSSHAKSSRRSGGESLLGPYGDTLPTLLSQSTLEVDSEDDRSIYDDSRPQNSIPSLQKAIIFHKVHSFQSSDRSSGIATAVEYIQVFTLNPPTAQLGSPETQLIVCVVDRYSQRLSILNLIIAASSTQKTRPKSVEYNHSYKVQFGHIRHDEGVIAACKIADGSHSRMLILRATRDGHGELSIEAPWSTIKKVQLPTNLLIYNPYQENGLTNKGRKRQGGLKRVLSDGVDALVSIEHDTGQKTFDIRDSKGTRHRIEVQMEPTNQLVQKVLKLCDLALTREHTELEPHIRAWWDVLTWLRDRSGEDVNLEWSALVVLIFSMFTEFINGHQTQGTLRQKKRKGALLRSSSGATADLDSWNAMMAMEGNYSNAPPDWLNDAAWKWTRDPESLVGIQPTSKTQLQGLARSPGAVLIPETATVPKSTFIVDCVAMAREFAQSANGIFALGKKGYLPAASSKHIDFRRGALPTLLVGLHLLREELKLNVLESNGLHALTPILAQLGTWLSWDAWSCRKSSYYMLENENMDHWVFDDSFTSNISQLHQIMEPPSILKHIEEAGNDSNAPEFLTLLDVCPHPSQPRNATAPYSAPILTDLTPRTILILRLLSAKQTNTMDYAAILSSSGLNVSILDTLPEGVAAPLRELIALWQADPVTTWAPAILELIDRDDVGIFEKPDQLSKLQVRGTASPSHNAVRDVHAICNATLETDTVGAYDGAAEVDRQLVTRMIFKEDQRFIEAMKLVHPLKPAVARCVSEPDWSDTDLLEAQQELAKVIAVRTLSVSPGRGMLFYSARYPLLTEKFPIHGFTLSCVMKPANTTVTADRNTYTEEKVSWAFFHAGVEAGLSISKAAKGIDTSWILFNKPVELNNRHAGFLLALGLNGHLKSIAKWVAFKYLTPKHTMTSVGLLLGLSASYVGTMDTPITRLLSVHVTRMLPLGAAELNLSPLTQTTGIMAIGLLYANSQHRRMSEIMLSEMENTDQDENESPMDNLRDEGYRLAAGFALGYINIGQGKNLKGLHDMHLVERLLALAVGTKQVDLVHVLDKATAAAVISIALIFMKTHDIPLSKKIDVPDTLHQFEYVRPDIFLLRTVARHLIMWNDISASTAWIRSQLPVHYQPQVKLTTIRILTTSDMPLLNIMAGLCFSIGLRYAGSARQDVRNLLGHYLDQFIRICRLPALNYDGKLTRITARNCQDVVALAAASVMAGTGDLYVFRRLRSLHSRSDPDTPYGSHLATHMAIGVLFLAGGTHSFSTSNFAIASLVCAFYPLFPTSVLDNKSHLQAFRHFWVLAAEPRCLVARDSDSHRPISMPIVITLRSGKDLSATAPCLLPELQSISKVHTEDPQYWRVTLDFEGNAAHLPFFKAHQSIFVRRRGAYDSHVSVFSATLQALNDVQTMHQASKQIFEWIFELTSFAGFDRAERTLVLPTEGTLLLYSKTRTTVVDDRLVLEKACLDSGRTERLWNLRLMFAWADRARRTGGELGWMSKETVEALRTATWLVGTQAKEIE